MNWNQLIVTVTGGVAVAMILALFRFLWHRTRLPIGLSRRMTRRNYLAEMLTIARNEGIDRLDALVPNLLPAAESTVLTQIKESWSEINKRRGVRVITRNEPKRVAAGSELLGTGIEVRVSRALTADHLSYHVFSGSNHHTVLNRRTGRKDQPERLDGLSTSRVFRSHFDETWDKSVPIESILADEILTGSSQDDSWPSLSDRIRELRASYRLTPEAEGAVLQHLAFRHRAPVIFITGLPGAGKSLVRRTLAAKLSQLRLQVDELSDYVYAFEDFLHSVMRLDDGRGIGFTAEAGGAFRVDREESLRPALHSLGHRVWQNRRSAPITLVEFARSDTMAALHVFGDEVLSAAQIIHVRAADTVRASRLARRGEPPKITVAGQSIRLIVSDDHRLPTNAANTLYTKDDFALLREQKSLSGRVHLIDNDTDAQAHIDSQLASFIEAVVRPYRELAA